MALSSCEAEIMAGSEAAKEAIYLSSFLSELGVTSSEPPPLRMDNKSAIADLALFAVPTLVHKSDRLTHLAGLTHSSIVNDVYASQSPKWAQLLW